MAVSALMKSVFAFVGFVVLNTFTALIYRLSLRGGKYDYSPSTTLVLAETIKWCLSIGGLYMMEGRQVSNVVKSIVNTPPALIKSYGILGLVFALNNTLSFTIYKEVDPSIYLMIRSGFTFMSALMVKHVFGKQINGIQWCAIALQICGLIITQWNPCTGKTVASVFAYSVIVFSIMLSNTSGVVNEYVIKKSAANISLNLQNFVLYAYGIVLNGILALFLNWDLLWEKGFFYGYTWSVWGIVLCHGLTGIAVTAIYKYTDNIIKTFGTAVTAVTTVICSALLFGFSPTLIMSQGCIIIMISLYLYVAYEGPLRNIPCVVCGYNGEKKENPLSQKEEEPLNGKAK